MKKPISVILAVFVLTSALGGCAGRVSNTIPVRALSSSAEKSAEWLTDRLGSNPPDRDILLGVAADADSFGADMSGLRSEGYVIRTIGNDTVILGKTEDGLDRGVRRFANYCVGESNLDITYGEGPKVGKLTIAGHGISEYSIRIEADSDELHPIAAKQLQKYIGDACGIYPPIDNNASGRTITLVQDKSGDHGDEAFTVSVKNGNVTITGGRYRGCIYGVYGFLEKFVGYRFLYDYDCLTPAAYGSVWFGSDGDPVIGSGTLADGVMDYLYEADAIDIPEGTDYYSEPDFSNRSVWIPVTSSIPAEDHALKMKFNRDGVIGSAKYNGYGVSPTACHGLAEIAESFVDYNGQGVHTRQPCFSNEENIEIACEYYSEKLKNMLASGMKVGREIVAIDVCQVDSDIFCKCEDCMKLIAYDRTNAAPVVCFTNAVADAIARIDPDVYVIMGAYMGTTKPPQKTKLRENVSVWYCFYNDLDKRVCYNHPLNGEECSSGDVSNALYAEEMITWSTMTDMFGAWFYPGTWFASPISSCTLFNVLDDFRFVKEYGVDGIFVDPMFMNPADGILNYLYRVLQWNCDMTDEEYIGMIKEYFEIMYGPGYENIYEYTLLSDRAGGDKCWSVMAWSNPAERIDLGFYAEMYDYMITLFDDASYLAADEKQEFRVRRLSMQMKYIGLIASYDGMFTNGGENEKKEYLTRWNDFVTDCTDYPLWFSSESDKKMSSDEGFFDGFDITKESPAALVSEVRNYYDNWWK